MIYAAWWMYFVGMMLAAMVIRAMEREHVGHTPRRVSLPIVVAWPVSFILLIIVAWIAKRFGYEVQS